MFPAAAADEILYGMTHEDMLDYGYIYEEKGCYMLPEGIIPPEAYFPSMMLESEPKYPSFTPNQIPWSKAPSEVQEILSMGTDSAYTSDMKAYEMPFVAVRVNSSNITVFVGINCFLGVADSTYNTRVCTISGAYFPTDFRSVCYTAVFNRKLSMTTPWRKVNPEAWGDTGNVLSYSSATFIGDDYKVDLYVYGGNGARPNSDTGGFTSVSFKSTSSTYVYCYMNNRIGFDDNRVLFGSAASHFPNVYVSTFVPDLFSDVDDSLIADMNAAEDVLLSGYSPESITDDFQVVLDSDSAATVFNLLTSFVFADSRVSVAILSVLCLGVVALLFNR